MKMKRFLKAVPILLLASLLYAPAASSDPVAVAAQQPDAAGIYNVRAFGAKGDARALDSPAINRAIDAAHAAGGGTVRVPAGTYRSLSIRFTPPPLPTPRSAPRLRGVDAWRAMGRLTRR